MNPRKKILIVDDDPDHHMICDHVFTEGGYEVFSLMGCDPVETLTNAVESFQPDLILMDHFMPEISGLDAMKVLKDHPTHKSIPIIYFTVNSDLSYIAEAGGADAYLPKPFRLEELRNIADRFMI